MIAITQPLTAETTDNTVPLPTSGAFDNGRIVAWYYDGTRAEYLTIEALAEAHTVSIEDATAWVQTARTVRFQLVVNGGNDRNHGRVLSTHDTREDAEQAASKLQAETREANGNATSFLDLRIDAVDEGIPSVLIDPMRSVSRTMRVYGFVNCAFHNANATGDTYFFTSRWRRDRALDELRNEAVKRGLSRDAAHSGIYPIAPLLRDAWKHEADFRNIASQPVMVDCAAPIEDEPEALIALSELAEGVCHE